MDPNMKRDLGDGGENIIILDSGLEGDNKIKSVPLSNITQLVFGDPLIKDNKYDSSSEDDSRFARIMTYVLTDEENEDGGTSRAKSTSVDITTPTSQTPHGSPIHDDDVNKEEDHNNKSKEPMLEEGSKSIEANKRFMNCPICQDKLIDESSTQCGHIFCEICILEYVMDEGRCPICQTQTSGRDLRRIYLPD